MSKEVSNDTLYHDYKAKKQKRDECYAAREQKYEEWSTTNKAKEQACRDDFKQAHDAAERFYYEKKNTAKKQRDDALASLAALEESCKKPKTGQTSAGSNGMLNGGATTVGEGTA